MSDRILINSVIASNLEDSQETFLQRVLFLDQSIDKVVLFSLTNWKKAKPITRNLSDLEAELAEGLVLKRTIDPAIKIIGEDNDLPEKYIKRRDTAWKMIKDIVNMPDIYEEGTLWALCCETAQKYHTQPITILKYLRKYWFGGQVKNALYPHYFNCGSGGKSKNTTKSTKKRGKKTKELKVDDEATGINVSEDMKKIFLIAIRLFYDRRNPRPSIRKTYRNMIEEFFNKGFKLNRKGIKVAILPPKSELPTYGQFCYWFRKLRDLRKSLIARHGEKGFATRKREKLGEATSRALAPGDIYEIDSTVGDVYLVNSLMRWALIGRPVIYVVIDVFSRLIVGIHVALRGPCWEEAALALYYAFMDKVEFCANYDIHITADEWPSKHLCNGAWADNGELKSKISDILTPAFNINLTNPPSYRPDWKPIVEHSFNVLNESIHWVPGGFRFWEEEMSERKYPPDGKLSISAITGILINNVLAYNSSQWLDDYPFDKYYDQR